MGVEDLDGQEQRIRNAFACQLLAKAQEQPEGANRKCSENEADVLMHEQIIHTLVKYSLFLGALSLYCAFALNQTPSPQGSLYLAC